MIVMPQIPDMKSDTGEPPILSQATLDITEKKRSNPLPWKGQFSPQLVEAHLSAYAKTGDRVLDPFAGSGTVLFEAVKLGLTAIGVEINPAAVMLARIYASASLTVSQREHMFAAIDSAITGVRIQFPTADTTTALVEVLKHFSRPSIELDIAESLVVACDLHNQPDWKVVLSKWRAIRALISSLPVTDTPPRVFLADARNLPVADRSINLILTSPPYINVFNYHQQYRASVETIGWDVLPIARSEIGSNRKFRANRLITVAQYCLDMTMCLLEVRRVLAVGGRAIFVVGRESNVRKTAFYNARILSSLAQDAVGLVPILEQQRDFLNRFGTRIYEDILHLGRADVDAPTRDVALSTARTIAIRALTDAKSVTIDEDILFDLDDAIAKAASIEASPMVDATNQIPGRSVLHHIPGQMTILLP